MSNAELPISFECDDPEISVFQFENVDVELTRTRCVDKMGPDENGMYDFYYDYVLYDFKLSEIMIHGRAYADETEAYLLATSVEGERRMLSTSDLETVLARAAIEYFKQIGRTDLIVG